MVHQVDYIPRLLHTPPPAMPKHATRRHFTLLSDAPQDQQARLRLVRPLLPSRIGRHIRTIVIEEVTLDIGLPSTAEEGEFVGPQIGIVPFHREVRADMSSARDGRDSQTVRCCMKVPLADSTPSVLCRGSTCAMHAARRHQSADTAE